MQSPRFAASEESLLGASQACAMARALCQHQRTSWHRSEGVSDTGPAPGWAFNHLSGHLDYLPLVDFLCSACICMEEQHSCTPEAPQRGPLAAMAPAMTSILP